MADNLTMNQVIHSAVRRDLARIERGLREMPDGDHDRAAQIQRTWDNLAVQLKHHHEGEDDYVWPWLKSVGVDPALLAAMESEHEALAQALDSAGTAIGSACSSASADEASAAADTVAESSKVVGQHLGHEESDLEPVMVPKMNTPEWKAVEKKLRSVPPVTAGWFFAWIQDGASAKELAYLRSVMPSFVLLVLTKLFGRGYTSQVASAWK